MDDNNHTSPQNIEHTLGLDQQSVSRKWLKPVVLILGIVAIGLSVWLWRLVNNDDVIQYRTVPVKRGDLTVSVTATGNLEPTNLVEVGIEVSGTIASVEVDFNDRVKAGQVLAKLDTDQLQAKLHQSKAALALMKATVQETEATVVETRNKLKRSMELRKQELCSPAECDAAQAAYDRAQASLARARAQVAQAQAQLDADQTLLEKAVIRSPIDGIVLKRQVEPGQTLAASLQTPVLFTLAHNLVQMELHVNVDEADVGQVKEGQLANFTVDAYPDRIYPAKISQVRYGAQQVEGVITYETVLKVDNSDLSLRPGMTATADIIVSRIKNALLIPNAALRFTPPEQTKQKSGGGGLVRQLLPRRPHSMRQQAGKAEPAQKQVWVLKDKQASPVRLSTGASNGIMTEVLDGKLEAGMAVIIDATSGGG